MLSFAHAQSIDMKVSSSPPYADHVRSSIPNASLPNFSEVVSGITVFPFIDAIAYTALIGNVIQSREILQAFEI